MDLLALPQGFGVEVIGFDVHSGSDPQEIARLRKAYDDHFLLIFRGNQRITAERQVELTGWFGPVINNDDSGQAWSVLSNDETSGSIPLPFHCDMSYTECPLKGISLHALEIPEGTSPTGFVSNAGAWQALAEELKRQLEPLTLRHFFSGHRYPGWPDFEALHPICLRHPKTDIPLLFVTLQHASRIVELDPDKSDAVLSDLLVQIYETERQYEHHWRQGDLLIWDNLAVQHARVRASDPSEGPRKLQRVALSEIGFAELFERAKHHHAASQR